MKTVSSIAPQVDEVRIYYTECGCDYKWTKRFPNVKIHKGKDIGSAAKFHWANRRNEYYFTCDDDLIYPPDYVQKTLEKLQKHGGYVSYHGRKLKGTGRNYYSGHKFFHCLRSVSLDGAIDIPGTGVGCFNTNDFRVDGVDNTDWRNMDDVAVGYLLAKQGLDVTVLSHADGWIKEVPNSQEVSIYRAESKHPIRQNKLADEVYKLKYMSPKVSVIIPYKVDRGWLDKAIKSVQEQTYTGEIELILSQSDANASINFNNGLKEATGEYIRFLCDDDILPHNSIADSVRDIQGYDVLHGWACNFYGDGSRNIHKAKDVTFQSLLKTNGIHGGTLFFHKSVFKYGNFNEQITTGEEFEFNLRLLREGVRYGTSSSILYHYRRHSRQKSTGVNVDMPERVRQINQIRTWYRENRSGNFQLQSA